MQHFNGFLIKYQKMRQSIYDQYFGLRVRVGTTERVRVSNEYPIDVVNVSKSRDACLIRHKKYQQG